MKTTTLPLILCLFAGIGIGNAQIRTDMSTLSTTNQNSLATLIEQYTDTYVISTHSCNTPMVHGNNNFLPFHREYITDLEDFLMLNGGSQFVPLPKWDPQDAIPSLFQLIDSDCASSCGGANCNPLVNVTANAGRALPASFNQPSLCTNYSNFLSLGSAMESPWHNNVHINVSGAMGAFKSPSAPIFFPWHAYVDDVWKEWECDCQSPAPGVDLWMRDTHMNYGLTAATMHTMSMDRGLEPNNESVPGDMWLSEDIWVRINPDGLTTDVHQNPVDDPSAPLNYVYVRVRNRGCDTSSGNDSLSLHWAKAATALTWPTNWNGSLTSPTMGDVIGVQVIPALAPGEQAILEFPWNPPNPSDYASINTQPWHFCLLARVLSTQDPMTFPETWDVNGNTKNNNNIAWKNVTVVDLSPFIVGGGGTGGLGGVVAVGNFTRQPENYFLEFQEDLFNETPAQELAEIYVTLDDNLFNIWEQGGLQGHNVDLIAHEEHVVQITGPDATLENLDFPAMEWATMNVTFNVIAQNYNGEAGLRYHVRQKITGNADALGGEAYNVILDPDRQKFVLTVSQTQVAPRYNEPFTLQTGGINEEAHYQWFDANHNLIGNGKELTASFNRDQTLTVRAVSARDGFVDYETVQVDVDFPEIYSIAPNPADKRIIVHYDARNCTRPYLRVQQPFGQVLEDIELNPDDHSVEIDVSEYPRGISSILLIDQEAILDYKQLSLH